MENNSAANRSVKSNANILYTPSPHRKENKLSIPILAHKGAELGLNVRLTKGIARMLHPHHAHKEEERQCRKRGRDREANK